MAALEGAGGRDQGAREVARVEDAKQQKEAAVLQATAPALARGLFGLLAPVVAQLDERLQGVFHSQRLLSAQLDRLSSELDRFAGAAKTPPLSPYVEKLIRTKLRMVAINNSLANIQARLSRIQRESAGQTYASSAPIASSTSQLHPSPTFNGGGMPHRDSAVAPPPATAASPLRNAPQGVPSIPPGPPAAHPAHGHPHPPTASTSGATAGTKFQPVLTSWLNKAKSALMDEPMAKLSNPQAPPRGGPAAPPASHAPPATGAPPLPAATGQTPASGLMEQPQASNEKQEPVAPDQSQAGDSGTTTEQAGASSAAVTGQEEATSS